MEQKQNQYKMQVCRFYEEIWDARDKSAMPALLHNNFTFRGSLGLEKQGHDGFSEYVDLVHEALDDYRCMIQELVAEGEKVFAKMEFTGIHRNEFLGYPASNCRISWEGCALFSFQGDKIADVWVLGDLKALEQQLQQNHAANTAPVEKAS